MKTKNFIKGLLLAITSLGAGFFAIAVPFRIFDNLNETGVRVLFGVEMCVYIIVSLIFLAIQDKKNRQKKREAKRHEERQLKVKDVVDNWYNIAA